MAGTISFLITVLVSIYVRSWQWACRKPKVEGITSNKLLDMR